MSADIAPANIANISGISTLMCAIYLAQLLAKAKPKHRTEFQKLYLYVNNTFFFTGMIIPRAFFPLITSFECDKHHLGFGITPVAVRTIILSKSGKILLGVMAKNRRYGEVMYDVGAGGMAQATQSPLVASQQELNEEYGLTQEIKPYGIFTPIHGYHYLVHVFYLMLEDDQHIQLKKTDGTFIDAKWVTRDEFNTMKEKIRDDGVRMMSVFYDDLFNQASLA